MVASSRVCQCALMAEMTKQYFPCISETKKWTFLQRPQTGSDRPYQTRSSIIAVWMGITFIGIQNNIPFQTLRLYSCGIECGRSTWFLIISSSSNVNERAYSILDSIPKRGSLSFRHDMVPICSFWNDLSAMHALLASWENFGTNHSSMGLGVCTAWVIALPLQQRLTSGILPSYKGTDYTFWAKYFLWAPMQRASAVLFKSHITESIYEEKGCIWLHSGAMLFLETNAKVLDCTLATLFSFSRVSTCNDHSAATILLSNSPTTSPSSSSHSSCQFTVFLNSFHTTLDSPPCSLTVSYLIKWFLLLPVGYAFHFPWNRSVHLNRLLLVLFSMM